MNDELIKRKSFDLERLFPLVFAAAIFLHLLLLWNSSILPFIDLPFRLAASTISRYIGEPSNQFAQYYTVDTFLKPNSCHLFFCSLKIFPSVDFANKVFYSIYMILLPLSILLTVKRMGGNTWFSLLSFLMLYNFSVGWGFSEFTMAIPVVILLFCCLNDHFNRGGLAAGIAVTLLFLLLFFIHVAALLFALFMFFVFYLYLCRKSPVRMIKKGVVVLPVLILILLWWKNDASQNSQFSFSYLWFYYKNFWLDRLLSDHINLLFWDNFSLFPGAVGKLTALFFSLFIISPFFGKRKEKDDDGKHRFHGLYIFLGCAFFFYLFVPHKIADNFHLFQRFAVFVLLALVLLDSLVYRKKERINNVMIISICAVLLLHFFLWAGYFRDFKKESQSFTRDLFPEEVTGKTLSGLIYDHKFRGRPVYIHFPNYYITWKRGIASTCLIDYRFGNIRRKASKTSLPPYRRIEWIGKRNLYDGRYAGMDYILVRGGIPEEHKKYMANFTLKRAAGKWRLYERIISKTPWAMPAESKIVVDEFSVFSNEPYLWSSFAAGGQIYIDRDYVYSSAPPQLKGLPILRTANNDKYYDNEAALPFISFRVKKDVTVYIIYTDRFTNLEQTWLNSANGWIKESFTVSTDLAETKSKRSVCSKYFPAGSLVKLGGNGCRNRDCDMYTVVIKEKQ